MMERRIYSAIDANINRSLEGVRVCEDIFRFVVRDSGISVMLKEARHSIAEALKTFSPSELLHGRDVENDSQKFIDVKSEKSRKSLHDLAKSNLHRAMEAMRSIEEFYKLLRPDAGDNPFQNIRFSLYSIEKEMIPLLLRKDKLKKFVSSLYAILDSSFVNNDEYNGTAQRLINGGASIIQLRMKNLPMRKVLETAKTVSDLCMEKDVLFIVNDHPDIAYLSGADGVHLGHDDLPVPEARRFLPPDMLIGFSARSGEKARLALESDPDYISAGPVFETKSKDNEPNEGISYDILKEVISGTDIPVVAIGGLDPDRISRLRETGCKCYAVLSYLYEENNIEGNCRAVLKSLK